MGFVGTNIILEIEIPVKSMRLPFSKCYPFMNHPGKFERKVVAFKKEIHYTNINGWVIFQENHMGQDPEDINPDSDLSGHEEPQIYSVTKEVNGFKFTRRDFLEAATLVSLSLVAVGCSEAERNAAPVQPPYVPAPIQATKPDLLTDTPIPSPTNTATPTSTKKPTATKVTLQAVISGSTANVRSGPGKNFAVITKLTYGASIVIIARILDSSWVKVRTTEDVEGWISTELINLSGQSLEDILVEAPPATPTPLPGKPGKPAAGTTGIEYKYTDSYGKVYTYSLPCGSPIPAGAVCVCNCVTVPQACSCDTHTSCTCDKVQTCTCDRVGTHYWYPN